MITVPPKQQFAPPTTTEIYNEAIKRVIPKHTEYSNSCTLQTFLSWIDEWNKTLPTDPVPRDLLFSYNPNILFKCLQYFVPKAQ